jgi:hypothetical protein
MMFMKAVIEPIEELLDSERIRELEDQVEDLEFRIGNPDEDFCRRCFKLGRVGSDGYCSRDCYEFAPQASFEVPYKQLHPEWPEKRGTQSTLLS